MSFKSIVATAGKKANKPSKGPQEYMKEHRAFISSMINNESAEVRLAACSNELAPAGMLKARLMVESDENVLRAIILNERTKLPILIEFGEARPDVAELFDADEDVIAKISRK